MSREDDYNYIFSSKLHEQLKEKVHGGIFCKVIDDTLKVKIIHDGYEFTKYFNNFSEKISNDWTVTHAMFDVMKSYKKFINSRYFK